MERVEFTVKGMTCNHCVMTVTHALKAVPGVKAADVKLDRELAKVTFDPSSTSTEDLKKAVIEAGYQVE